MRLSVLLIALAVVGVSYDVRRSEGREPGQTVSIASGQFSIQQAPARDTRQVRTGTGRIRGRVVNEETGAAVRRAMVRLSSPEIRESRAVASDADGNFEFRDLPSGSYQVYATKSGYLGTQYGAERFGDPGTPVKVAEGQTVGGIDVALARGGAIGGRVLDEFGEPMANVFVQVMRRQSVNGVRRLMQAGSSGGGTNDLGQFRVYGLQPGTYYVAATARSEFGSEVESPDRTGYAPTYYPGTPNVAEAQAFEIRPGLDVSGADFMLIAARVARVSGMCVDSSGRALANASVSATLAGGTGGLMMGNGASVRADGNFSIANVPPGEYLITARAANRGGGGRGEAQMEIGQTRVHVSGTDVTGVFLQTTAGSTLSGQVVYDGATPRTGQPPRMSLNAIPVDPFDNIGMGGSSAQVQADGTFTMRGLFGTRAILVSPPSGWMVKGLYLNGRDVSDTPLSFDGREQMSGLQVVLTDRLTHVTGTVVDERGGLADPAYVVLVPSDAGTSPLGMRRVRTVIQRAGAPWKADGIPPGDYVAIALRTTRDLDTQDIDFLERVRKIGIRFSIREGETKDVSLKLSAPPT